MDITAEVTGVWEVIGIAVTKHGTDLLGYLTVLAAIGTLAMALVEILKSVGYLQMWFNKWKVSRWARETSRGSDQECDVAASNAILAELLLLAAGGARNWRTLFDQPIEKMMGQIQAAANVAIEHPNHYRHLYDWLTAVPTAYWERGATDTTRKDGQTWVRHIEAVNRIRALPAGARPNPKDVAAAQEASKARARLNNLVTRKLDAFQNNTQYSWARWNQYTATVFSVAIFLVALWDCNTGAVGFIKYAVLALPAGVVAPFAKQLTGSLSTFARK